MGFGFTFVGYFIAYLVSMAFPPVKLLGYALLIWGCIKLSEYNTRFRNAVLPLGFLSLMGVYSLMETIYGALGISSTFFEANAVNIAANISEAIDVAFHACLLIAVCSIAKETGLDKMAYKSMRNLLIVIASEVAYFVAILLPIENVASVVSYIAVLLRIIWIVLNVVLMANCYKMICPEGDESMPRRESKIPFVNKFAEALEKRENEAIERTRREIEEKKKKAASGGHKKKHKKRR